MKTHLLPLLTILFAISWSHVAAAQSGKVVQCGVPTDTLVKTDPGKDYCDIYSRQLAYKDKRLAFRKSLEERRVNYAAPGKQAVQTYEQATEQRYYPKPGSADVYTKSDSADDEPLFKALDKNMY